MLALCDAEDDTLEVSLFVMLEPVLIDADGVKLDSPDVGKDVTDTLTLGELDIDELLVIVLLELLVRVYNEL